MLSYFKKKKDSLRSLTKPEELMVGDIVVLKERLSLPSELQGLELEVTHVSTYQYASGIEKEFTLRSTDSVSYYMSVDDNDGDPILCFTIKIPRESVLAIFDEDEFARLWEPEFASLKVVSIPEQYADWLTDSYQQIIKDEEGYYYPHDCSDKTPSKRLDDDGEELRYHECEGEPDDNRSLIVEVFGNGETNVFLEVSTPLDVIAELWPHAKQ